MAGLAPFTGLDVAEEEGPASAFRDRSAMVAILVPEDGVGLMLDAEGGADGLDPPF